MSGMHGEGVTPMRRWLVVTPVFSYMEVVCDGAGPMLDTCDVIEVEAETARDAVALGVKAMIADRRHYSYCRDQRWDGASPYTGVRAEPKEPEGN